MNPPPADWPRLSACLVYQNPARAIDWLCAAFGFELRLKVEGEDGTIHHSELTYGGAVLMVGGEGGWSSVPEKPFGKSPRSMQNHCTASLMVYVDDVEAHCAHAKATGAVVFKELAVSDYGEEYWTDKGYGVEDLEGHVWYFAQRLRSPK